MYTINIYYVKYILNIITCSFNVFVMIRIMCFENNFEYVLQKSIIVIYDCPVLASKLIIAWKPQHINISWRKHFTRNQSSNGFYRLLVLIKYVTTNRLPTFCVLTTSCVKVDVGRNGLDSSETYWLRFLWASTTKDHC